ncbi:MAG: hypothetical protein IJ491_07390 [Clostridia bacterium]|nr:hypothetical protein [Clostridia bacterium]
MTTYLSMIIGACFLVVFMIMCNKKRCVLGVYIKNLTSIFFLLTAVTGAFNNTDCPDVWKYALPIVMGGVFGLMGDIYLDQKWLYPQHNDQYLNMGFISFGIGHFFYMGAMFVHAQFSIKDMLVPVIIGVIVTAVNLALEKPTKQKYGKFFAIVTVYCLILGTMLGTAFWAYIKTKQVSYLVYTIGAASFLLSDVILSPMYFAIDQDKNTPLNFVLNHATYYIGQYMIALTPFLLVANS